MGTFKPMENCNCGHHIGLYKQSLETHVISKFQTKQPKIMFMEYCYQTFEDHRKNAIVN